MIFTIIIFRIPIAIIFKIDMVCEKCGYQDKKEVEKRIDLDLGMDLGDSSSGTQSLQPGTRVKF